jgi:AraC-like DNA-binding protein
MKRKPLTSGNFLHLDQIGPVVELAYCWHHQRDFEAWYRSPCHGFMLIERGVLEIDAPHGVVRAKAGDLVYSHPVPRGHYRVLGPTVLFAAGFLLGAPPRHLLPLYLPGIGQLPSRISLGPAFAEMRSLLETLCVEVPRTGVENRLRAQGVIYQALAVVARVLRAGPPAGIKVDGWERARIRLDSSEGHNVKIADLAHDMNVSVQYFQRHFRRRFHASPKAYQLRSRINEAVRRLRDGEESFKTIAYDMGFRDPKILYHAIRRNVGVGPTKLRQMTPAEVQNLMPKDSLPFPLNRHLVPPGTPADWARRHEV